ncbi:efflux transporter outer membrane subunit [Pseudomonas nicosulfuronedens]
MSGLPRSLLRLCILGGGLWVGGCSWLPAVGPDYRSPETSGVKLESAQGAAFSPQSPPGPWWQLYQNAELNGYIGESLRENRDLRIAASRLEVAQASRDQALAAQWPGGDVSATYARERGLMPGMLGFQLLNATSASLNLSYELDLYGRIRRSVESATASLEEQQFAFAASQIRVAAETANAYVSACQAGAALASAEQLVGVAQKTVDTVSRMAKVGAVGQFEVTRAQAQVGERQAAIPPILAQRKAALYSLAVLLGRTPENYPAQAARCDTPPTLEQPLPVGDGLALLRRRPDVAAAERTLAAATARIGMVQANLYPQISLGVSGGGEGTTVANTFSSFNRAWSVGPLLSWTFPNQLAIRAQMRAAGAEADMALSNYQNTLLTALKETETALDGYARTLEQYQRMSEVQQTNKLALSQASQLYSRGSTAFLDLLAAQRELTETEQKRVDLAGQVAARQIAVFQALGGGWDGAAQVAAEQAKAAAAAQVIYRR